MSKLTKADLAQLDMDTLQALQNRNCQATYVLRNHLDWPGKRWHRKGLTTAQVLRSIRRLVSRGLAEQYHGSSYMVMLSWRITDAGRAALAEPSP